MITKPRLLAFFWVLLIFFIQNGFHFFFPKQTPSLLLIATVFYALYEGPVFGLVLGCYAGFFSELFGVGKMGYGFAIFGFVGFIAGGLSVKISRENIFTQIFFPTAGSFIAALFSLVLSKKMLHEEISYPGVLREAFVWPLLFWTAIFSYLFFRFFKPLSGIESKEAEIRGLR